MQMRRRKRFVARSNRPVSRITRPEDRFPPVDPSARKSAKTALAGLDLKADKITEIATDATLTGGGDLSADRTLGVEITAEEARIIALIQSKIIGGLGCTVTVVGDTIEISVP
jgi:hypothetical protein